MTTPTNDKGKSKPSSGDSSLERIADAIDPPSREVTDDELIDPGANTPGAHPDAGKGGKPKPLQPK